MITFTEVVGCDGTVIYQAISSQLNFFTSGRLQLLLAYDGMLLLKLNEFQYGISGVQSIIYDHSDPQFSLVLYLQKYPHDQWILKVNENSDAVYSCLSEKCHMRDKKEKYAVERERAKEGKEVGERRESGRGERVEKREVVVGRGRGQIEEGEEKEQGDQNGGFLIGASKQINKGLLFTGGLLSKGFQSLGGLISKRVQLQEQKQISSSTRQNLKLAKQTTKNVLIFTSQQIGNLFRFGKKVASDVGQRFEKSEKGRELQEHPYYEGVKEGAKTGAGVIANIYDGVVGAVYAVGGGVAKGVTKVVGAKYGSSAEEAVDEALEGAGNVVKVLRVPQDQAAKALK